MVVVCMNKRTEQKIEDLKKLMAEKVSVEEIAEKRFSGNKSLCKSYILKFAEFFQEFPEYIPEKKSEAKILEKSHEPVRARKTKNFDVVDVSAYDLSKMDLDSLKKLSPAVLSSMLVMSAPEILSMMKNFKHLEKINKFIDERDNLIKLDDILRIPDEIVALKDSAPKSYRISKSIEKIFDKTVKQYPHYTKTAMINMALKEFAEKYYKK